MTPLIPKELEWEGEDGTGWQYAMNEIGPHYFYEPANQYGKHSIDSDNETEVWWFDTEAEAKAAAQADYNRRWAEGGQEHTCTWKRIIGHPSGTEALFPGCRREASCMPPYGILMTYCPDCGGRVKINDTEE